MQLQKFVEFHVEVVTAKVGRQDFAGRGIHAITGLGHTKFVSHAAGEISPATGGRCVYSRLRDVVREVGEMSSHPKDRGRGEFAAIATALGYHLTIALLGRPWSIVTDRLRYYSAAMKALENPGRQECGRWFNNRAAPWTAYNEFRFDA